MYASEKQRVTPVWVKVVKKWVSCWLKRQIALCINIEEQLFIKWSTSRKPWLVKTDAQLWCHKWKEASYWEGIVHSKWNYERQIGNFNGALKLQMKRILFFLRSEIISASTLQASSTLKIQQAKIFHLFLVLLHFLSFRLEHGFCCHWFTMTSRLTPSPTWQSEKRTFFSLFFLAQTRSLHYSQCFQSFRSQSASLTIQNLLCFPPLLAMNSSEEHHW